MIAGTRFSQPHQSTRNSALVQSVNALYALDLAAL
jgi:hypothetical protein